MITTSLWSYGPEFSVILLALSMAIVSIVLVGWMSRRLDRLDRLHEKAAMETREARAFLESVVENIPTMLFIKDAKDLRFVKFNRAAELVLGQKRENMLGKNDYDFFPKDQADFFVKKDRDALSRGLQDIAEEPIQTPQGERILHTKKISIRNEKGEPLFLLGISEDITERRRKEIEIQNQKILQQSIIDSLAEGLVVANADGKIILFNPAAKEILGLGNTDAGPREWSEHYGIFHSDKKTPFLTEHLPLVKAMRGEPSDNVEMFIRNAKLPNGRLISVTGRPIRDNTGKLQGGLVVCQDLSRRPNASEK